MAKISAVMFDRSMWFAPVYQTMSRDGFYSLSQSRADLVGKEGSVEEPVRYALGYAQMVLLGTAVELTLLHHYVNSLAIYELLGGDLRQLAALRRSIESGRRSMSIEAWLALEPEDRNQRLREMSFSDLPKSQSLFADIYGADCFRSAWTPAGFDDLARGLREMQVKRNGIVHRGGEFNDGTMIQVSAESLSHTLEAAGSVRLRLRLLSEWCRLWWIQDILRRFSI